MVNSNRDDHPFQRGGRLVISTRGGSPVGKGRGIRNLVIECVGHIWAESRCPMIESLGSRARGVRRCRRGFLQRIFCHRHLRRTPEEHTCTGSQVRCRDDVRLCSAGVDGIDWIKPKFRGGGFNCRMFVLFLEVRKTVMGVRKPVILGVW